MFYRRRLELSKDMILVVPAVQYGDERESTRGQNRFEHVLTTGRETDKKEKEGKHISYTHPAPFRTLQHAPPSLVMATSRLRESLNRFKSGSMT